MNKNAIHRKKGWRLAAVLFVFFAVLAAFAWLTWFWQARHWDNIKFIEIITMLKISVEGTSEIIMRNFRMTVLLPSAVLAAVLSLLLICLRRWKGVRLFSRIGAILCALALIAAGVFAAVRLDLPGYLSSSTTDSEFIEEHYVDPNRVEITFPEKKRNLIYIWLESVESTYTDPAHGGAFEKDVIPELTAIAEENPTFTGPEGGVNGGVSTLGTTWTMGALFAQTCGLPLKIPITNNSMSFQDTFFPGVTTLGDILAAEGYQQGFLIGSKGEFGGRKIYFTEHGGYTVWDHPYSQEVGEIPEDYKVWWGYEDQKLFTFAKKHITDMAATGEPFNFSMLTVDTHFPDGYVCPLCDENYEGSQYSMVMSCSSKQVSEFIGWIKAQPFYDNTTVVLTGDHITMNVDYCTDIDPDYQRKTYTVILNPDPSAKETGYRRSYATMDLFPTTLAALGARIEGDRLGLGTNLYSEKQTYVETFGAAELDRLLGLHSDFMDRLSGIDGVIYELSEAFSDIDLEMKAEFTDETATFTVYNLDQYADKFERVEIFAEIMRENTRTTLRQRRTTQNEDGSYSATFKIADFKDHDEFLVNVYVLTSAGRIKVSVSYECVFSEKKLTDPRTVAGVTRAASPLA